MPRQFCLTKVEHLINNGRIICQLYLLFLPLYSLVHVYRTIGLSEV